MFFLPSLLLTLQLTSLTNASPLTNDNARDKRHVRKPTSRSKKTSASGNGGDDGANLLMPEIDIVHINLDDEESCESAEDKNGKWYK